MSRSFQKNFVLETGPVSGEAWRLLCSWDFSVVNEKAIQYNKNNLAIQLKVHICLSCRCHPFSVSIGSFCTCLLGVLIRKVTGEKQNVSASTLLLPVVVSLINLIVPLLYSLISTIESYSNPRAKIYISIIRSVILKMSILGILCFYWLNFVPDNISVGCWESFVGQSVYRLLIIDFIFCLLGIFFGEFLRLLNLGVPEFDIARNVLDLIYAQTLAWIGIYFSPLLPVMQVLKLFIIFYLKKISLSMNCQPPKHTGRAAQIQTVFIALLFFPSFVGVLSMVAFTVWRCDPFILHFQFLFIIVFIPSYISSVLQFFFVNIFKLSS
uniref:Transmembrane channel-like protein n=1 Tax=Sinocyclocheilus rhinocerous TaxID=307959 RepID=A0A673KK82_9TELE